MFDLGKFSHWVSGGLFENQATWEAYKAENHPWQATAKQFTAPLVVFWGIAAVLLGWLFSNGAGFYNFLQPVLSSLVWFGLGGFIASFLAGKFSGTPSYGQALAALTFASIPGAIGGAISSLPVLGWVCAIGGFIWALMLLWQALPTFLDIPLERRVGHYFLTLGTTVITFIVVTAIISALGLGLNTGMDSDQANYPVQSSGTDSKDSSWKHRTSTPTNSSTTSSGSDNGGGIFGFGRELDYLEAAGLDTYTPPAHGRLEESQVERTVKFFAAANRLRDSSTDALKKLEDKDDQASLGDLFKGVKGLVGAGTAEMQSVKSGGGNWAEHEWVKRQLFEARIHQDLNDTTNHNFELYQKYEDQLKDWL